MSIQITDREGCSHQPFFLWDTIWIEDDDGFGSYGDWLLVEETGPEKGSLRANSALHTATTLCVFTDARLPDDWNTKDGSLDPRGWWGNDLKLDGELDFEIGSLLWWYRRSPLTQDVVNGVHDTVLQSLSILKDSGAVAKTTVDVQLRKDLSGITIKIMHYDVDGVEVYRQPFGVIWNQVKNPSQMKFKR